MHHDQSRWRGPDAEDVALRVNAREYSVKIEPRSTLLDALRDELGLFGTKLGCAQGACGACTVLVDGRRVLACLTLAMSVADTSITTIEGLADGAELHPLQAAFVRFDALQCGFCTPGQLISAVALLREGHANSAEEIREWMSGNLCRCGAYANIMDAIRSVSRDATI